MWPEPVPCELKVNVHLFLVTVKLSACWLMITIGVTTLLDLL